MKLVASLITKNEISRYLEPCLDSLLKFCDEVWIVDDRSDDGTYEWLVSGAQVARKIVAVPNLGPSFFEHEGRARQTLLAHTLHARPTHILAIDADEFVADGSRLRQLPYSRGGVWSLVMEEVWKATPDELAIRQDGGWRAHPVCCLYQVHRRIGRIADRALACGREPLGVRRLMRRAMPTGTEILHFGWTKEEERDARYQRYALHDAGQFHRNEHLESIMWPDAKVTLTTRDWPADLDYATVML